MDSAPIETAPMDAGPMDATPMDAGRERQLVAWDLTLTRAEAAAEVAALAARLRVAAAGAPVAVLGKNSGRTLLAYTAVMTSGSSLVPLTVHLRAEEIAHMLRESGAVLLLCGPELGEVATEAARGLPVEVVCWAGWDAWRAGPADPVEGRVAPPILFSSGTTGRPKRTLMPRSIFPRGVSVAEFRSWAATNRFVGHGPHLVSGPLYHSGPIQATALLTAGVVVHVPRRFDPAEVLELIERERIATSLMVPTHFVRLLKARTTTDVGSIRLITQTGARCPEDVKRAMVDWWGPVFFETYGGTETGGVCGISTPEWLERPGSVGRALPGYRVFTVDEAGAELPAGAEGRLYFENARGWGIEYLDAPELTAAANLRPGVFTLGEIGRVDADGYVFLTDRDSDKIVTGGVNIYPAESERVLAEHPAVADVAVIGVDHPEMGEEALALVVAVPGATTTEDELVAFCRERLSAVKTPRRVRFVESVDRSVMGKINRRALRATHAGIPA